MIGYTGLESGVNKMEAFYVYLPKYEKLKELLKLLDISRTDFEKVMDGRLSILTEDIRSNEDVIFKTGMCIKPEFNIYIKNMVSFKKICLTGCEGLYRAAKAMAAETGKNADDLFYCVKEGEQNEEDSHFLTTLKRYRYLKESGKMQNGDKTIAIKEKEFADHVNFRITRSELPVIH